MANSVEDDSSFINEESDNNVLNLIDKTAVANDTANDVANDVEINDANKLKTKVMPLKMVVTKHLQIIKQSVGSPTTSVCNCSSKNNIYID